MLRVTKAVQQSTSVTLKVEGRIASEWIDVLERECRTQLEDDRSVLLDFSNITFIDRVGVEMLKSLAAEDVEIINCSVFITDLLNEEHGP